MKLTNRNSEPAANSDADPSPVQKIWDRLTTSALVRFLLLFACGWALTQFLAYFATVLVIFIFAAILAFLLHYPVKALSRFIPRVGAVVIVFLGTLILAGGLAITLGVAFLSQGQQFLDQTPDLANTFVPWIERLEGLFQRLNLQIDLQAFEEEFRNQALAGIGIALGTVQQMLANLLDLILIAVIAFFMLLDGGKIWNFLLHLLPRSLQRTLPGNIQRNFLGFFWGRLLLSIFFGISAFIVFLILGVPFPLILAGIAGVFDLIPGIGATLGISLISLILLPQGIWLAAQVLVICVLLQQVEENLLMPRIMQDSINLNPVVMFFALLVGARVAGLVGIFLSIPVAGVIVSLLEIDEIKGSSD